MDLSLHLRNSTCLSSAPHQPSSLLVQVVHVRQKEA
jgi:hypothetical protein